MNISKHIDKFKTCYKSGDYSAALFHADCIINAADNIEIRSKLNNIEGLIDSIPWKKDPHKSELLAHLHQSIIELVPDLKRLGYIKAVHHQSDSI